MIESRIEKNKMLLYNWKGGDGFDWELRIVEFSRSRVWRVASHQNLKHEIF